MCDNGDGFFFQVLRALKERRGLTVRNVQAQKVMLVDKAFQVLLAVQDLRGPLVRLETKAGLGLLEKRVRLENEQR